MWVLWSHEQKNNLLKRHESLCGFDCYALTDSSLSCFRNGSASAAFLKPDCDTNYCQCPTPQPLLGAI